MLQGPWLRQSSGEPTELVRTSDVWIERIQFRSQRHARGSLHVTATLLGAQDAFHNGPREKLAYLPAVQPKSDKPDYLMTVDLDPESSTYSQVLT